MGEVNASPEERAEAVAVETLMELALADLTTALRGVTLLSQKMLVRRDDHIGKLEAALLAEADAWEQEAEFVDDERYTTQTCRERAAHLRALAGKVK